MAAVVAGVGTIGFLVPALAQRAPEPDAAKPPPRLVFQFGSKLASNSNYNLSTTARPASTLDGTFGLTYNSVTRISSLRFSASGALRTSTDGGLTGTGLREPSVELAWRRATPDESFSFGGRYTRERTAETTSYYELPDGTLSPEPLVSSGTVSTSSLNMNFETGLRAPLGFALKGSALNRLYDGAVGTDAYDIRRRQATATVKLRPGQMTEYNLGVSYQRERDDNILQTRRRDTGVFVGMQRSTAGQTLSAQLGYQRSTTDQIAPYGRQESRGLYGSVGLTRAVATGTVSATLSSARDSIGLRNTLSFGTVRKTRDGGKFSAKLGLAARSGSNAQLVGSIAYGGKLPAGSYSLGLDRSVALNADNIDVAYTRLSAGYKRRINTQSSVGIDLSFSRTSGAGFGVYGPATTRQSVALSLNHDLTRDWELSAGVKHLHQNSAGGTATDNSAFLAIRRSFTLLP